MAKKDIKHLYIHLQKGLKTKQIRMIIYKKKLKTKTKNIK